MKGKNGYQENIFRELQNKQSIIVRKVSHSEGQIVRL